MEDHSRSANKILAIVGTNNPDSVNKKLIKYVSGNFKNTEIKLQNWEFFDAPVYSLHFEKERGFPVDIQVLNNTLKEYNALIIAVTEHNLTISAFLKNIIDWMSRLNPTFLKNKKILLMSTSDDEKGAANALAYMNKVLPTFGADVVESFSLAQFSERFDEENNTLRDEVMLLGLLDVINNFKHQLEEKNLGSV